MALTANRFTRREALCMVVTVTTATLAARARPGPTQGALSNAQRFPARRIVLHGNHRQPGKVLATSRLKGLTYRPNDLVTVTEAWLG
jgi:hypothetical protein